MKSSKKISLILVSVAVIVLLGVSLFIGLKSITRKDDLENVESNITQSQSVGTSLTSLENTLQQKPVDVTVEPVAARVASGYVGKIDGSIDISFTLDKIGQDGVIQIYSGSLVYNKVSPYQLALEGTVNADGSFVLNEWDGATKSGVISGVIANTQMKGTWTSPDQQTEYIFSASPSNAQLNLNRLLKKQEVTFTENKVSDSYKFCSKDVVYPRVSGTDKDREINEILISKFDTVPLLEEIEKNLPVEKSIFTEENCSNRFSEFQTTTGSLNQSYTLEYLSEDIFSMSACSHIYMGGAHGVGACEIFHVDIPGGREMSDSEWFKIDNDSIDALSNIIREEFKNTEYNEILFDWNNDEKSSENIRDILTSKMNYYPTDSGIVFQFYSYEIAPYVAGFPSVEVSYETLGDLYIR